MKIIFKVLTILLKILLCFLLSIFFIGSIAIELMVVGISFEIIFFAIFSLIMILITLLLAFVKIKKVNTFFKIIIFVVAFFLYMKLPLLSPNVREAWDKDICYDDGYCKEGILYGGKTITKEYCINNGYKWIEKYKSCDLRKSR